MPRNNDQNELNYDRHDLAIVEQQREISVLTIQTIL
jgi:hypothetical protein